MVSTRNAKVDTGSHEETVYAYNTKDKGGYWLCYGS